MNRIASAANLTLTPATGAVYGQPITATANVTDGAHGGTVQFFVGESKVGSPVVLDGDHATSAPLTDAHGGPLAVGSHPVRAVYSPADAGAHAGTDASTDVVIAQARTTSAVTVSSSSLHATVTPVAPGAGVPTGTVTFAVAGHEVGHAALQDGVATLAHVTPHGSVQHVAAIYSGDDAFTASSASTSRTDPTITAAVRSAHATSRYGWYRTPVTVSFACATHGSPLNGACPKPVTLGRDGAAQTVTRWITSADGGIATVSVRGVNIDRTAPSVSVTGVRNGATYRGGVPSPRCSGRDATSGLASCTLSTTAKGSQVSYVATATDRAGSRRVTSGTYRQAPVAVIGTSYRRGAYTVHAGHGYQLVVIGGSRPRHVWAAPSPRNPAGNGALFRRAGTVNGQPRWVLGFAVTRAMLSHPYWNLGVRRDGKLTVVRLHVVR